MFRVRTAARFALLLFVAFAFSSLAWAQEAKEEMATEKKIARKDVPTAVMSAFEKAYPKAKITGTSMETEAGTTYYEIESREAKVKRDVLYNADGTVKEVEESMTKAQLPTAVKSSLHNEYPKGVIQMAEKSTSSGTVSYEVHLKSGKDRMEIVLDDSGKILKTEKKTAKEAAEDKDEYEGKK